MYMVYSKKKNNDNKKRRKLIIVQRNPYDDLQTKNFQVCISDFFCVFAGRMDIKETDSKRLTHNLRRPFGIGCKLSIQHTLTLRP